MNRIIILKIILLIFLPLIVGFWLFYQSSIKLDYQTKNNITTINVPDFTELNELNGRAGGLQRTIRTIFAAPLDLKYYTIKIKDISKYEGTIGDSGYILSLDDRELNFFKTGGEIKTIILTNKPIILNTKVKLIQGSASSGSAVKWILDFEITARPSCLDVVAKIFLFLIAWNVLFFLGLETFNFIKGK